MIHKIYSEDGGLSNRPLIQINCHFTLKSTFNSNKLLVESNKCCITHIMQTTIFTEGISNELKVK